MPHFNLDAFLQQFVYDPKNPLLFNNGFFVFFFAVFIALYYYFRSNFKLRRYIFCFFSLYFFYKASGYFVVFVVLSAIVDYVLSNAIFRQTDKRKKKFLLICSIVFNLGLLFYFKYTNFFIATCNDLLHTGFNPLNILLPVGISFYTFENLSYTIDVYRGRFEPARKFSDYLLFLSFFPKLVMGPIVRAHDFVPQINKPYVLSDKDFSKGFYLIISGLFKKLVISDYITLNLVNYIFDDPGRYTGLENLFAVYGYAVVIYCDFSGYSDVAIGIAKWLGFTIPANFKSPYQSKNITEFWRRWHISLSSWLRDYLYIPLGGNRKGIVRTYINLMLTMLLGGLWHGASWNFIAWGGLHGIALALHKIWREKTERLFGPVEKNRLINGLSVLITFHFVCFCWIFFKAANFTDANHMIHQILHNMDFSVWWAFFNNYKPVLFMIALAFLLHSIPDDFADKMIGRLKAVPLPVYLAIFFMLVIVYGYFKSAEPVMPIYLQF
ncbi:MAG TPA: MBOAT family O-acyltransferase [Chitinophagaceae bacterium]|nr:MBOAT family O-acyltransferase [Chitinophagaceae bacterium]